MKSSVCATSSTHQPFDEVTRSTPPHQNTGALMSDEVDEVTRSTPLAEQTREQLEAGGAALFQKHGNGTLYPDGTQ